jgi:hypothetical protein
MKERLMALDFKRRHLQPEVMLMLIRWYVARVNASKFVQQIANRLK